MECYTIQVLNGIIGWKKYWPTLIEKKMRMRTRFNQLSPLSLFGIGVFLLMLMYFIGNSYGGKAISGQKNGNTISVSDAEVCIRSGGIVYFNVTFGTQEYLEKIGFWEQAEPKVSNAQPFVINAGTHIGTVQEIDLEGKVSLFVDGNLYPMVSSPIASNIHQYTWLVFLPKYDNEGEPIFNKQNGNFEVYIDGLDIPDHRVFNFKFPINDADVKVPPLRLLAMIGAVMAAMLLTCTPYLVGSLAVGSFVMGASWGMETELSSQKLRERVIHQTSFYLVSFVAAYAIVTLGTAVFEVSIERVRPFEVMGGSLLVLIGLNFFRMWKPVAGLENVIVNLMLRIIPRFNYFTTTEDPQPGMAAGSSIAMGVSMAMVCSIAGVPALTNALILPVISFAGLDVLAWSLAVLMIYLIMTALPFFLITVGLGEIFLTLTRQMRNMFLMGNASIMIVIGTLVVIFPDSVAGAVSTLAHFNETFGILFFLYLVLIT